MKTHPLRCHFILKMVILPRQARDEHKGKLKKRCISSLQGVDAKVAAVRT
jgi:hypothetical protein